MRNKISALTADESVGQPRELFVVANLYSARSAGFQNQRHQHPMMRDTRVFWPGMDPDLFRGIRFDRIIVDSAVMADSRSPWRMHDREMLRAYCTHADTLWIEP